MAQESKEAHYLLVCVFKPFCCEQYKTQSGPDLKSIQPGQRNPVEYSSIGRGLKRSNWLHHPTPPSALEKAPLSPGPLSIHCSLLYA